jgi:hypothetical protein
MRKALQVRWTIIPKIAPQPWIMCSGCGGLRAFQSSDKIRLNANGRKLDAWLIYKCLTCDKSWNRPIFERQNVRDIDPAILEALRSNDPDWIYAEAFNLEVLRRSSHRIDEFAEFEIRKQVLREAPDWTLLEIELSVPFPTRLRLDRLLASELKISRSGLSALRENGLLRMRPDDRDIMRRRIRSGMWVTVDLTDLADGEPAWRSLVIGEKLPLIEWSSAGA